MNKSKKIILGLALGIGAINIITTNAIDADRYKVHNSANATKIYKVNDFVNVRKENSSSSDKVGALFSKESVEVLSTNDDWAKINYGDDIGYVDSEYLTKSRGKYIVTADSAAIFRKGPSTTAERITEEGKPENKVVIPRNEVVDVIEIYNGWAYLKYNDKYGYVHTKNLKQKADFYESTATFGVNVRKLPSPDSEILGKVKKGYVLDVISMGDKWAKVEYENQIGYVSTDYINKLKIRKGAEVSHVNGIYYTNVNKSLAIRNGAGATHQKIGSLENDIKVRVLNTTKVDNQVWAQIEYDGTKGWCNYEYLSRVKSTATDEEKEEMMMLVAKEQLGKAYDFGSIGVDGFDCSGFMKYIFQKGARINLPRLSYNQANEGKILYWNLSKDSKIKQKDFNQSDFNNNINNVEFQFGDLLFFNTSNTRVEGINHVGMYIGNGKYIHSPKEGDVIRINNMNDAYMENNVTKVTRVL